jgi:hypothetical protein
MYLRGRYERASMMVNNPGRVSVALRVGPVVASRLTGVSGLDRYAYACMRGDGTRLGVAPRVWPMSWSLLGSQ